MKRIFFLSLFTLLLSSSAAARVPVGDLLDGVKPGPDGKIDVLTVFSHQDDESISGGGALLLMKKDPRVRLFILCATFDQTSPAMHNLGITPDHIGNIRVEELETAAAVYRAEEVIQFMYHGRTLADQDPEELIEKIGDVIERVGAEIVITHDPQGITGHWDHQALCRLTTEAFRRSDAKRLYYTTMPRWAYRIAIAVTPYPNPVEPASPTVKVNIKEVRKLKRMACYSHASQMFFSSIGTTADMRLLEKWEYFALAESKE